MSSSRKGGFRWRGGRIFKANAAPAGSPWMWTLAFGHHEDRTPTHGYAATRETAIYQCHLFDSVHTGSLSSVIIFCRGDTARVRSRGVHWRGGRSFQRREIVSRAGCPAVDGGGAALPPSPV
jgi:hypothetical protein